MDRWQILVLAGGLAGAGPVAPIQQDATPPTPMTTWDCTASSPDGTIRAQVEVDVHGKSSFGEVTWKANVGDGLPIRVTLFASFSESTPQVLRSNMLFLAPDLSDKVSRDALRGRRFQWVVSTHSGSDGQYPFWSSGTSAFVSDFIKMDSHGNIDQPEFNFDPDSFFAMARGSDQLFLVARDRKGAILLGRRFLLSALRAWPNSAQDVVRKALDLTPNYLKSCERDDHDLIVL